MSIWTNLECNTKHAHYTNVKHVNTIRKLVPSVFSSRKKKKANKVRSRCSGTHDHFNLAFQYQILKNYKKEKSMDKNNRKLKILHTGIILKES